MGSAKRDSGRTLAAIIIGGVGAVLAAAGGLVGWVAPRSLDTEWERLVGFRRLTAAGLREAPPGVEAFVEGRLAPSQPAVLRDFVAYRRAERRRSEKNEETWVSKERVTPALLVDLADGPARVVNTDYEMKGSLESVQDSSMNEYLEKLYSGLVRGAPVLAVGRTTAGGLEAEFVAIGTYESYRAELRRNRKASVWLAGGLAAVGGMLLSVALGVAFVRRRGAAEPGQGRASGRRR